MIEYSLRMQISLLRFVKCNLQYFLEKSTCIIAQLYIHNESEMAKKTGLNKDIFHINFWNKNLKDWESNKVSKTYNHIDLINFYAKIWKTKSSVKNN